MCRIRTASELQFLEVLTAAPGINPTFVNNKGIGAFEVVDSDDNSLLHIACAEGKSRMFDEEWSRRYIGTYITAMETHTPIHTAFQHFRLDTLKMLLESRDCDMPLDIVCRMSLGSKLPFLKMLLSTLGIKKC